MNCYVVEENPKYGQLIYEIGLGLPLPFLSYFIPVYFCVTGFMVFSTASQSFVGRSFRNKVIEGLVVRELMIVSITGIVFFP
jgi:uncharacterized membrane protein